MNKTRMRVLLEIVRIVLNEPRERNYSIIQQATENLDLKVGDVVIELEGFQTDPTGDGDSRAKRIGKAIKRFHDSIELEKTYEITEWLQMAIKVDVVTLQQAIGLSQYAKEHGWLGKLLYQDEAGDAIKEYLERTT